MTVKKFPDYGFVSQAMQCDEHKKYTENCLGACKDIPSLKVFDESKICPRGYIDKFGRKFNCFKE